MRIVVIGAGQVGATIVEALHADHELTLIDLDPGPLNVLSHQYDVQTVRGSGASRHTLQEAGISKGDLLIACTSRDEINIVAAMLAKKLSQAKTIIRTTNIEYLQVWHERQLDVDFMICSELEAAHAVARIVGVPTARQTDVFADGQVQLVEFDVPANAPSGEVIGRRLRDAKLPRDSKVVGVIRGDRLTVPRGDQSIDPGDRLVIIGSPEAARAWGWIVAPGERKLDDVVIFGAGGTGVAIAQALLEQGIRVRLIEADADRAREVAEQLPQSRVFHAVGTEPEFVERERIGQARAGIFAMREDAKNLYAAVIAKLRGVGFTVAIAHEPVSVKAFERAGIDVAINPRSVTAAEIVRFAHDPRIRQLAMLEGDRFEVLDITVRRESELVGKRFRELPLTGSLIGAIVRQGRPIFPHGDDRLQPGDRAIIFVESSRVSRVERVL